MSRNGSMPQIETDEYDVPALERRVVALEIDARDGAEQRGQILAGMARLEARVRTLRSKSWTAKEWAVLIAAVAAAGAGIMQAMQMAGK